MNERNVNAEVWIVFSGQEYDDDGPDGVYASEASARKRLLALVDYYTKLSPHSPVQWENEDHCYCGGHIVYLQSYDVEP